MRSRKKGKAMQGPIVDLTALTVSSKRGLLDSMRELVMQGKAVCYSGIVFLTESSSGRVFRLKSGVLLATPR